MATPEQAEYAPPAGDTGGPSGPRAGFWRRFAASLMDGIGIAIVSAPLAAIDVGVYQGATLVIGVIYYSMLEGGPRGQTLGKRAMGIRVIDFAAGGAIGPGRGFIRYVGRIVSSIPLLLGYFWMLWDREKQTWHDKMAGAVVVPVQAYPVAVAETDAVGSEPDPFGR